MVKYFAVLLLAALVAGCGYDPDKPVYDTAKNPDNFPDPAISLLVSIQSGKLDSYDAITDSFAELYTQNPELLDNESWKEIIDRLGEKFRYEADELLKKGPEDYSRTASLYLLASFARPDDKRVQERARLFTTWTDAMEDTTLAELVERSGGHMSLEGKLELLRHFEVADSLSRRFAFGYLRHQLFELHSGGRLETSVVKSLTPANQALVSYADLTDLVPDSNVAVFENPKIDLVALNLVSLNDGWYRLELYFVPRERITKDYTVAIHIPTGDSTLPQLGGGALNFLPFDFEPQEPTSQWTPGKVLLLAKRLYYTGDFAAIRIGLYERGTKPVQFVPISGSDEQLVVIPVSTLEGDNSGS